MSETRNPRNEAGTLASVTLSPCPERKLIRPGGCYRHIDFRLGVSAPRSGRSIDSRQPIPSPWSFSTATSIAPAMPSLARWS